MESFKIEIRLKARELVTPTPLGFYVRGTWRLLSAVVPTAHRSGRATTPLQCVMTAATKFLNTALSGFYSSLAVMMDMVAMSIAKDLYEHCYTGRHLTYSGRW